MEPEDYDIEKLYKKYEIADQYVVPKPNWDEDEDYNFPPARFKVGDLVEKKGSLIDAKKGIGIVTRVDTEWVPKKPGSADRRYLVTFQKEGVTTGWHVEKELKRVE